jgi:hypothetical protein
LRLAARRALLTPAAAVLGTSCLSSLELPPLDLANPILAAPILNAPILASLVLDSPILIGPVLIGPVLLGPVLMCLGVTGVELLLSCPNLARLYLDGPNLTKLSLAHLSLAKLALTKWPLRCLSWANLSLGTLRRTRRETSRRVGSAAYSAVTIPSNSSKPRSSGRWHIDLTLPTWKQHRSANRHAASGDGARNG